MSRIGDVSGFSFARAYEAYGRTAPVASSATGGTKPIALVQPVARVDQVQTRTTENREKIGRLVAARVPMTPDIAEAVAASSAPAVARGALPLYRHPADKNAAATSVTAGRVLDVRG